MEYYLNSRLSSLNVVMDILGWYFSYPYRGVNNPFQMQLNIIIFIDVFKTQNIFTNIVFEKNGFKLQLF